MQYESLKYAICVGIALASIPTQAQTTEQLETVSAILTVADWTQTRYIAKNPEKFYETNPILGKHPNTEKVDMYFVSVLIANHIITKYLPVEYKKYYQYAYIAVEANTVRGNISIGIKMKW